MNILFLASEAYPLAKTGGLGDVVGALPAALAELGERVAIMVPGYPEAMDGARGKGGRIDLGDPLGAGTTSLVPGLMPDTGIPVWLVDCPRLFDRRGGLYQGPDGTDWPDNDLRFATLSRAGALLGMCPGLGAWRPDVIHANDWQSGLVSAYLAMAGGHRPASVFTIHNISFTGSFPKKRLKALGLPPEVYGVNGVEFYDQISFLKAGLYFSDQITTVSAVYAREIQNPADSYGLHGLLSSRENRLRGILNGVDYTLWNPASDSALAAPYQADDLAGKGANKEALRKEMGLPQFDGAPLLGVVSRLSDQKGMDLILGALGEILQQGAQMVVLGSGEPMLERAFAEAAAAHPDQIAVRFGFDERLAHRILAGGDILLMPSRFEPCGLTQLYALRYGMLPVVRRTGGLAESVIDVATGDAGTGFVFGPPSPTALSEAIHRAITLYRHPRAWQAVQRRAMHQDFSWERAAREYMMLYRDLVANGTEN